VPPQRADVINLSLGGSSSSQTLQDCIDAAWGADVIIVAAAGNAGTSAPVYPAAYNHVISVSAVDIKKNLAPYSSFGPTIDVAAPGGNLATDVDGDGFPDGVLSTVADDTTFPIRPAYGYYAGTSMATPHVAGVAALMKSIKPSMTTGEFDTLLSSGTITDDLGAPGADDQYGYGLINAYKAVTVVASGTSLTPFLAVNPRGLNFGVLQNVAQLTLENGGQGSLTVNPPDVTPLSASSWLTVQGSGLGTYTISVNRTNLAIGTYTANIQFTALEDPNPVNVAVTVQEVDNSVDPTANAGFHYVALVNADDLSTQRTVTASFTNGVYSYQFYSIPPGTYKIYAGTDSDNDSKICDAGEACGAYATTDQPVSITVGTTPLTGLDFSSGFSTNLGIAAAGVVSRKPLTINKGLHKDVANVQ